VINISSAIKNVEAATAAAPRLAKLKQATKDFEANMVKSMITEMRKSMKETQFGEQPGGDIYKDMLDDVLAKSVTSKTGFGMAQTIYQRLAPEVIAQAQAQLKRA
jgi:Rod binding domain-containing protein